MAGSNQITRLAQSIEIEIDAGAGDNSIDIITVLYTDGSCVGRNGHRKAGWAVVDGSKGSMAESSRSWYGQVPGAQTNNRGELSALLYACKLGAQHGRCTICTDSQYAIDCVKKYCPLWKRNGWVTVKGQPVKNRDLIEPLWDVVRDSSVVLRHVHAHAGNVLNERADMFAKHAAMSGNATAAAL